MATPKRKIVNSKLPGRYSKMTAAELKRETAIFNQEFIGETAEALTPGMAAALRRAEARPRGRPRVGAGAEKIRISIERSLLNQADALAKRDKTSRSELIADGLRLVLARRAS